MIRRRCWDLPPTHVVALRCIHWTCHRGSYLSGGREEQGEARGQSEIEEQSCGEIESKSPLDYVEERDVAKEVGSMR